MNTLKRTSLAAVMATIFAGLTACGGGGGSTASSSYTPSSTVQGVITNFGSVWIDGVEYETDGAEILVDGQPGTEADLDVGMYVTLTGSADGTRGQAMSIEFDDDIEGVVESVDAASGALRVMGQNVVVDANTVIESDDGLAVTVADLTDLAQDHVVEVSGYNDGQGNILATRIELKARDLNEYRARKGDSAEIEVKGVVSNVDPDNRTFMLGGLTVEVPAGVPMPADGEFIEVKSGAAPTAGRLTASRYEPKDGGDMGKDLAELDAESDDMKVEGLITDLDMDAGTFRINGQPVSFDSGTRFEDGRDASGMRDGLLAKVEGYLNADGQLVAREMEMAFRGTGMADDDGEDGMREGEGRIAGVEVDPDNPYAGMVTLESGEQFRVDGSTIMKDEKDGERYFTLDKLQVGDWIEMNLLDGGSGSPMAGKLERKGDGMEDDMEAESDPEKDGVDMDGSSMESSDDPDMDASGGSDMDGSTDGDDMNSGASHDDADGVDASGMPDDSGTTGSDGGMEGADDDTGTNDSGSGMGTDDSAGTDGMG